MRLSRQLNSLKDVASGQGRFFFSAEDLPQITSLLRERLPDEADQIIFSADAICDHCFRLLGHGSVAYGRDIDWHLDAVSGKRAPFRPWYRIPFLDFSTVGDHKVIWELNRHQHLVTLAKAWALTQQEKYATEAIRQWYSWRSSNPFPMGVNWASSLEVAFRSLSWLWVRNLLAGFDRKDAQFDLDLLQGLALNGKYIYNYLSTYFSPNTHLLGEAVALCFIGTLCPQLRSAGKWWHKGVEILLREAERQVRADGVHFEQSLYYHVYALDLFLHFRLLAQRNDIGISACFDAIVNRMLDVLQRLSQAGPPQGFGDDDGGRVFNPQRNRREHLRDPLALGAILYDRAGLASPLTEEALWLFGFEAVAHFDRGHLAQEVAQAAFKSSGIYVMASPKPRLQQMVIDAAPIAAGRGGHGHADALNVTLSLDGRESLIDPGTFCYVGTEKRRDQFRGTSAHNTLQVDGLDQAIPDGPFGWQNPPAVQTERYVAGKSFSLFVGSHKGYVRLPDPVVHRRFVFYLRGSLWLIRDMAEGQGVHQLVVSWHFAPGLQLRREENTFWAFDSAASPSQRSDLALICAQSANWIHNLECGESSPAYGAVQSIQVLRSRSLANLPAEQATAIVPIADFSRAAMMPMRLTSSCKGADSGVRAYECAAAGAVHQMIFSQKENRWRFGPWVSDAEFLYCGMRRGEITHLVFCNGSCAELRGDRLFEHSTRVERFEWVREAVHASVFASDDNAIGSFSGSALECCRS
ncbi:MAG TPA: alginate lyase family protein [Verrucomicrobiae bacterium]|nr:alginate lyase family protein [Verrucomicrobiae bacterium]